MADQKVTQVNIQVGVSLESTPSALTQAVLEAATRQPIPLRASQIVIEPGRKFYTKIHASQTVIEVIRKRRPAYYTDGAAACNFTY